MQGFLRNAAIGAVTGLALCAPAGAELLGLTAEHPLLTFNNMGMTEYDAAMDMLVMDATPIAVQFVPSGFPRFVQPTGMPPQAFLTIHARVNDAGNLVASAMNTFEVVGQVDEDGDGTVDYDGVLLAGDVVGFGWDDNAGALAGMHAGDKKTEQVVLDALSKMDRRNPQVRGMLSTDKFDFRVRPTGGSMLSLYPMQDIAVLITSEMSTFAGDFNVDFTGECKGTLGGTPADEQGACCLPDGSCIQATPAECLAAGGEFQGVNVPCTPLALGEPGRYKLYNHPDASLSPPGYGLRLDEFFDVTHGHDKFTVDFEAPDACMFLDYDGTTIRIHGTALAGLDRGSDYDPAWTSMVAIDFTYDIVEQAVGDDDLIVTAPSLTNEGTIVWLDSGDTLVLRDQSNGQYTFRFGDEDDDLGHRGFPGLSGWGWFEYPTVGTRDWIFTAGPLCEPEPPTGACCLTDGSCIVGTLDECLDAGGVYQGDDTACTPTTLGDPGLYRLGNHPIGGHQPPSYGLRLDDLFDVNPGQQDRFSFDFEAPGTAMFLQYDGSEIRIFGRAYGGLDVGDDWDPAWTSFVDIDFTYTTIVGQSPGDDDLIVTPGMMRNAGTITWAETGEVIPFYDYEGDNDFTFRFGNEDDDMGHRHYDGLSGWGWLSHHMPEAYMPAADWLFIATDICVTGPGLVLHYDFDNQDGHWVTDRVGDIDLKIKEGNGDVDWINDSWGTGVYFDQSTHSGTARIQTESSTDAAFLRERIQATNALTVQVVFRQDGAHQYGSRLISYSSGTDIEDRNFSLLGRDDDGNWFRNKTRLSHSEGTFNDGPYEAWTSDSPCVLAFTYDANAGDELKVYVDGELIYTDSSSKGDLSSWIDRHLFLGNEEWETRPYRGALYDVKIWDGALADWEIQHEADEMIPDEPPVAAAILHYDFSNQSGDVVTDRAGGVDLEIKEGNGDIDWFTDDIGAGIYIDQSRWSGTARLETESNSTAASLRAALQSTDAITIQVVFQQYSGSTNGARVLSYSSGTDVSDRNFSIIGDPADNDRYDNWTRLTTDEWTFSDGPDDCWAEWRPCVYTMTYDAHNDSRIRIYMDGEEVWSRDHDGDFDTWVDRALLIGNEESLDRPFKGRIWDVRIWNRALSSLQVSSEAQPFIDAIEAAD